MPSRLYRYRTYDDVGILRYRSKGGVIRIDTEGGYLKKISRSVQDSFLLNDRFHYRLIAAFLKYYVGGTPVCTLR